jgi:DNA-binding NtrC family response regulator
MSDHTSTIQHQKSKTILILEDEVPLLEVIRAKLVKSGFEVVTARSVEQGMGYLNDGVAISAIWLDHYLFGKESGLDFVAHLKSHDSKWSNIPIFVVSNTATPEKVHSYMRLGVHKYYTKVDFRLDQIIADINNYLFSKE